MKIGDVVAVAARFGRGALGDAVVAWNGDVAYALSYDRTVLLRGRVEDIRADEVRFRACDWEGPDVRMKDGRVTFRVTRKGQDAEVTVPAPGETFRGFEGMWARFWPDDLPGRPAIGLHKDVLAVLDDGLPHVEMVFRDGHAVLAQRDIYTGRLVKVRRLAAVPGQTAPMAMRTADFLALFWLADDILLRDCGQYFIASGRGWDAVIGGCLYDELGVLNELAQEVDGGRQEQQSDAGQPDAHCGVEPACGAAESGTVPDDGQEKEAGQG